MKLFLLLTGIVLLLGSIYFLIWIIPFEMFHQFLINDVPLFIEHRGSQYPIPGRVIAGILIAIPLIFIVTGVWLLKMAIEPSPSQIQKQNPIEKN